jgi:hypothetical protein
MGGMPVIRIPRVCNALRNVLSLSAKSARERVGRGSGPMRNLCDGVLDFVEQDMAMIIGVLRQQMYRKAEPAAGSAIIPGLRPN